MPDKDENRSAGGGEVAVDPADEGTAAPDREHAVPGQLPGDPVQPVPSPGTPAGTVTPGVEAAQGPSPQDGIHAGTKDEGSDASVASPGAFTALAPPGKPDGEVDTRSR